MDDVENRRYKRRRKNRLLKRLLIKWVAVLASIIPITVILAQLAYLERGEFAVGGEYAPFIAVLVWMTAHSLEVCTNAKQR